MTLPRYTQEPDFKERVSLIKSLEQDFFEDAIPSFLEETNRDGSPAHTAMAPQINKALQDRLIAKNQE